MGLARFPFSASVDGAEGPVHKGDTWRSHMLILTGSTVVHCPTEKFTWVACIMTVRMYC